MVSKASLGSGKLLRIEVLLNFKRCEQQSPSALLQVETMISIMSPYSLPRATMTPVPMSRELLRTQFVDASTAPESPKHESATVMLQKVYKSLCTRRQLADCVVLIEQSCWKLLDLALLKRWISLLFSLRPVFI